MNLPSDEAVRDAYQAAMMTAGYPATVAAIGHKAIITAYLTQTDEGRALVRDADLFRAGCTAVITTSLREPMIIDEESP